MERRHADAKLDIGRLEGDLALASERLHHAGERRAKAGEDRTEAEAGAARAQREHEAAALEAGACLAPDPGRRHNARKPNGREAVHP